MFRKIGLLFSFIAFASVSFSQITGKLEKDGMQFPFATIYFQGEETIVKPDFYGLFKLPAPKNEESLLIIETDDLQIQIQNISNSHKAIELGTFIIPTFKTISESTYNDYTEEQRNDCEPIYCWAELLGYFDTNELDSETITLNCGEVVTDFKYNPNLKTLLVDWEVLESCAAIN